MSMKIKPNQKIATRTHTWTNGKTKSSKKKNERKKKSIPVVRRRWNKDFGGKMKTGHRKRFVERKRVTMRRKRFRFFQYRPGLRNIQILPKKFR